MIFGADLRRTFRDNTVSTTQLLLRKALDKALQWRAAMTLLMVALMKIGILSWCKATKSSSNLRVMFSAFWVTRSWLLFASPWPPFYKFYLMDAGRVWLLVVPNSAGCCWCFHPGNGSTWKVSRCDYHSLRFFSLSAAPKDPFVHGELLLKVGVLYTKSTANKVTPVIWFVYPASARNWLVEYCCLKSNVFFLFVFSDSGYIAVTPNCTDFINFANTH